MGGFLKKFIKGVTAPFQYAVQAGSTQTHETGRSNSGGQIAEIKTINLVIALLSFDTHLRSKGVNEAGIVHFACLKWVDVGSRQRMEFHHYPNETICEKIGVAVRRIDQNNIKISIVWKQSSVRVNAPVTLIHTTTRYYGFGTRNSDHQTKCVGRGLTHEELARVKQALENQAIRQNPQIEALGNV